MKKHTKKCHESLCVFFFFFLFLMKENARCLLRVYGELVGIAIGRQLYQYHPVTFQQVFSLCIYQQLLFDFGILTEKDNGNQFFLSL